MSEGVEFLCPPLKKACEKKFSLLRSCRGHNKLENMEQQHLQIFFIFVFGTENQILKKYLEHRVVAVRHEQCKANDLM